MNLRDKNLKLSDYKHVMAHSREIENLHLLNVFNLIQNFLDRDEDYHNFLNRYSIGHKVHNVKSAIKTYGYFNDNFKLPAEGEGGVGNYVHKAYRKFLRNLLFEFYQKKKTTKE